MKNQKENLETKSTSCNKEVGRNNLVGISASSKGITLIALTITIIVLLILAGITIASLTGENGILTKATEAKEKTEAATNKELIILNRMESLMNDGYFIQSSTINGEEQSATNPTIPAGFKPVNTDTAKWTDGENGPSTASVNAGLVIEDESGNQFVWIPVNGTSLKYEKHTYVTPYTSDTAGPTEDTENGNWKTYKYRAYKDWNDDGGDSASVEKYKGFYLARYEAGIRPVSAGTANYTYTSYTNGISNNDITTQKPLSQKNCEAWNGITQPNAKIVASKMYEGSDSVTSQLVDGYAWDTVSQWLSNSGKNVTNSTSWGNYLDSNFIINGFYAEYSFSGGLKAPDEWTYGNNFNKEVDLYCELPTGVFKSNNIYDFAGNIWERTTEEGKHDSTEADATIYVVRRGGGLHSTVDYSASYRGGNDSTSAKSADVGFRVVLYVK